MLKVVRNFFIILILVVLIVLPVWATMGNAHAADKCSVQISTGGIGVVVCAGEVVKQVPLPTVKVTVPGPTVTDIIKVPGPTKTFTVTQPGPTTTVTAPGPTTTVTDTVTASTAGPVATETIVGPNGTKTIKETVTAAPEPSKDDHKIGPVPEGIAKAGIGILSLILVILTALGIMYTGYTLGYKDADKENASFMNSISDSLKIHRKQH